MFFLSQCLSRFCQILLHIFFFFSFHFLSAVYKGAGGQVECCRNDSFSELCFRYEMGTEVEKPQKVSSPCLLPFTCNDINFKVHFIKFKKTKILPTIVVTFHC